MTRTKIFTAYENAERPDPADRVELVREGFSLFAFLFHVLWLLYNRLWIPAAGFVLLIGLLGYVGETFHLSQITISAVQLFLQLMLGFVACDVKGWNLARRGYRMTGVVAAETELHAQRRYYDAIA